MIFIKHKRNKKSGMTLIEIILAMAILGMIVVLMTPVLVSGFNMITLSGNRHVNAKGVAGNIENNLAGETVTASLYDVTIKLPGDIIVDGKTYTLDLGSDARQVDLNGYIINSIPVIDPTAASSTTTTLAPTESTTAAPTETPDPTAETTAETTATSAPTTTAPTEAPISLGQVTVDVSGWRNDVLNVNKTGTILNTTSGMQYRIVSFDGSPLTPDLDYINCNPVQTTITLNDHNQGYQVIVRQITNTANNKHLRIRPAPQVAFHNLNNNKTSFYIYDTTTLSWRSILTSDRVELILTPGDTWTLVTTGKDVMHLDTAYVYARRAASADSNVGGVTYSDPASFPRRVNGYQ